MNFRILTALAALLATLPCQALAHTGDHFYGVESGFLHPFSGLDHLLAMVAVGMIAARLGGSALWRLPLAFVSAMVSGAVYALTGGTVPLVETAIITSVVLLGAALIANANMPVALAVTGAATFGFFHGFAHGTEGPAAAPLGHILGFAGGTVILHITGIAACHALARHGSGPMPALRIIGTGIIGAGIGLAFIA
ncbi:MULTISPECIES: HupE/UreJ family protein [Sinorhizobium]|uniref:HupE/UreJ family protein n=1 Tax=Sinorhizobium TaxID=28105 RepID=UPI000BEA0C96|nr:MULTISPECIES: HupE/UreJ family protein [Sinorhizobium]PDT49105.1 iron hydrogenase [Sinorhizobium sp. NG07B]POH33255.1 iron hydrogenase [Sinorhizobium americanum]